MSCYIGPYAKLTKKLELVKVDLCATHNFLTSNFCSVCGKSQKERYSQKTIPEIPSDWDQKNLGRGEKILFSDYLIKTNYRLIKNNNELVAEELLIPNRFVGDLLEIAHINSIINNKPYNNQHGPLRLNAKNSVESFKRLFSKELKYASTIFDVSLDFGYVIRSWG